MMIDFHSHILPNVDDGAKSKEETFELLAEAKKYGFKKIVATPHYIEKYFEKDKNEIKAIAKNIIEEIQCKEIEIILGNELYFSKNIVHLLKENKASTIGNSNYVLLEYPMNEKPLDIYEYIYMLQENGYIPILAHPERYQFVQKDPSILYDFVDMGVLLQANYGSIMGIYGKMAKLFMEKMLQSNLVAFLGSDVHRKNTIYPMIPKALNRIEKIVGKEKLEELVFNNPERVLNNETIEMENFQRINISFLDRMIFNYKK